MLQENPMDGMQYASNLSDPHQSYPYVSAVSQLHPERPRPSSARDPVYADLLDSSFYNQRISPQNRAHQVPTSLYDGRAASADRGSNYSSGQRNYVASSSQRYTRSAYPPGYIAGQNTLYQPSNSLVQAGGHRRAHSYEMNLERQGLSEHTSAMQSSGISTNLGANNFYGNIASERMSGLGGGVPVINPTIDYGNFPGIGGYGGYGAVGNMTLSNSSDIISLQRECVRLHQELEVTKEKLNACMTSIRTFWSPELKRERAMRKDENAKYAILADHLHQLQLEKQTMLQALHDSDTELRREREKNASRFKIGPDGNEVNEIDVMNRRIDELTRENRLLSKSVEDAEKRALSMQNSLVTTEESLRRLVEAVKSGKAVAAQQQPSLQQQSGSATKTDQTSPVTGDSGLTNIRIDRLESDRNEIEQLREQLNEAFHRESEAEKALIECELSRNQLKIELDNVVHELSIVKQENESLRMNIREVQTLQAVVDTKESKILTLENEIRLLEDEIVRLRDEGMATPTTSLSSGIEDVDRTLNTFRSNERLLKSKVEFLTSELSKRDNEIYALQSRLEMTEKQQQDQNHHINVLKEQVKARDNKVSMLTADIEDFRKRLKEKEGLLEKKSKMMANNATGKRQMETELAELKDQVDLKERKISLLQRKIENLEEMVAEKESQLTTLKSRLSRLSTEKTGSEVPKINFEDALKEKDRQIERLKEARERSEAEWSEEAEGQRRAHSELRNRLDAALRDLDEKSNQLSEVRDEVAQLRSSRYKRDSEVSQLQVQLRQREAELSALQLEKQMLQKQVTSETEMKYAKTVADLEAQANHYMESATKLQSEVDRLLNVIRSSEADKLDKENQIHELEEQLHDAQNQIGSLKRSQQADRKKNNQMLDEARQKADTIQNDAEMLKNVIAEKEVRVRELEQALRESVRLTAEREAHVASREDSTRQLEHQLRELRSTVEPLQRERNNLSSQLASVQEELRNREGQLKNLEADCFQSYIPELEKLRQANQEANLRIAALVKLVQGQEDSLTEQDKSALATVPLFPSLAHKTTGPTRSLTKSQVRLGGQVGPSGFLTQGMYGQSGIPAGSVSPHLAGSAFHLIGSSSAAAAATTGALGAGGINLPIQNTESILLGRLLHEKETMLQQQLHELTRLRFQNSEMDVKIKSLQRELDAKTSQMTTQATTDMTGLVDWQSQIAGMPIAQAELATLRKANTEMREKLIHLQNCLQERENELIRIQHKQTSASTLEIERLKLELAKVKEEHESVERNLRIEASRASEELTRMNTTASAAEIKLQEREDKIKLLEFERAKMNSDLENLQSKYHTVLGQLTEKTDKMQQMEEDCVKNHIYEIQRLSKETEDLNHRVNYLHKTLQEREAKLEQQETELSRRSDETANYKKKIHSLESEVKSQHDDIVYKDERLRQLQVQQADEISRMRSAQQEQESRLSHLQLAIDEKDHDLKTTQGNLQNQSEEVDRLQNTLDETKSKANIMQKRIEEREQRLRKLETENHDFLDEIHGLRKRNHEMESHIDVLRQRLLDRGEQTMPPVSSPPTSRYTRSAAEKPAAILTAEAESLRKRNTELENEMHTLQKRVQELQIQIDHLNYERENLSKSYEEEMKKRLKLEGSVANRSMEFTQKQSEHEDLKLTIKQLKSEIERKETQIRQLTQQVERNTALSRHASTSEEDKDAFVTELKLNLQRFQQALDAANDQNRILQARNESTILESQQQHLIERQALQEQISNLRQNLSEMNAQNEHLQREIQHSSGRIQEVTRQLRETQMNCDSIASQRDNLQSRLEQLQKTNGGIRSYNTSGGSILGRPASVAAGYSDLLYPTTGSAILTGGQLSRELDRLNNEHEAMKCQLDGAQLSVRQFKQEAESAKREASDLRENLRHTQELLQESEETLNKLKEDSTRKVNLETEKHKQQQEELCKQLENLKKQVSAKDSLVEQLTNQLSAAQENCRQLEQKLLQVNQQIESLTSQQDQVAFERNQQQRLSYELETVKKELSLRENQFNQLTQKFNQSLKESNDQSQMIEQLSQRLEAAKLSAQQAAAEAEDAQRKAAAWATEQSAVNSEQSQRDHETIAALKADLLTVIKDKEKFMQRIQQLENDLQVKTKALDTEVERAQNAGEICKREHLAIIDRLSQENQDLKVALKEAGNAQARSPTFDEATNRNLKQEVDILKKELDKRDVVIAKLEKECQEKHVRKLEALQVQLRRYEEDVANLNRVLDEQRKGIEDRDQLVRQLRAENQKAVGTAELEKLRAEHARCAQQIQAKQQQLETLMKQLEQQAEEILTTKIEALTASMCEKDANLALIQTSGPQSATSKNAIQKLTTEKEAIQTQLRQLTFARDALTEQRKAS
ncbi:hypothetical protein Aperf_G00000072080 [Anoplocephala perfoliata]